LFGKRISIQAPISSQPVPLLSLRSANY